MPDGTLQAEPDERPAGVLCGSFNPLHEGHIALREAAERRIAGSVWYELSVVNADKPPLDLAAIERRRRQFTEHPIVLTRAATFVEKARLLAGTVFVVGVDTAERIIAPRFYGGRDDVMRQSLAAIRRSGCRFLVAGRKLGETFRTLGDLCLPSGTDDLFEELPASMFRVDVSSTARRSGRGA